MANYIGPKVRLSRRVGSPVEDIPKHTNRQLVPPGMHGYRGRRLRDYGIRLNEKQRLRYHYNVMEKQFVLYIKAAARQKGNTADNMIVMLESRLDNVVRRLGWSRTIWQARQIVAHGLVKVNGTKTDRPSYQVKVGDTITLKEKSHKMVRENMESLAGHHVPEWLSFDPSTLTANVQTGPSVDETMQHLPFELNMNLIIEFYR